MEQTPDESTFRWKWLAIVPVLLIAGWLGYRWVYPAYSPPVLPVPNAYDTLVALGDKLAQRTGFYADMPDQELAMIVAVNEPILVQAREALRKESVVSLDWNADQIWFNDVHRQRSQRLRELARAFAAEGRHAQKTGDTRRAVACGLEALQLVPAASNGGLGIDYLVGLGINNGSLHWLRDACETATLEDCKYLLNNLPDVREQMESPADLSKREHRFMRQVNGIYQTFVTDYLFNANRTEFEKLLGESLQKAYAVTELLRLHYAIRAFNLTEQRLPKSLDELAGRELEKIPFDPFGEGDFIYLPGKDRYLLYSVGPNGIDDGGVEDGQDPQQGDLLLESRKALQIGSGTLPAN